MKRPVVLSGLVALLFTSASIFVKITYGQGGAGAPPTPAAPKERAGGRLQLVEGRIPVAHLKGTHFEIGKQHGELFKDEIRFHYQHFVKEFAYPVVGEENLREWALEAEPFIPEKYRDEIRGLAEGAGVPYEDALLFNTLVDRLQSMFCSTVTASGSATKDGEVIFGRNLDFPSCGLLYKTTIVLVFEPEGETPVVTVTWPGLIGALSGMNGHGVAGATMMIHRMMGRPSPGTPYMILYRDALSRAKKADDVFDVLKASKRTCPNNFMVMDATGAAVVVEFDARRIARRDAERGCLCGTNYFRTNELQGVGNPMGRGRYDDLAAFLRKEHGKIDVDGVREALIRVARPWFMNVQSMIFLPRRRAIHLSVGGKLPAATQPFLVLDRKLLFGEAEKR